MDEQKQQPALSIGQMIRVYLEPSSSSSSSERRSCRATISFLNEGSQSVDVIFDHDVAEWTGREEEANVKLDRILPLFSFEAEGKSAMMEEDDQGEIAAMLREQGNELFKIGDYAAALARYRLGVQKGSPPIQIGSTVMVTSSSPSLSSHQDDGSTDKKSKSFASLATRIRQATVSDVDDVQQTADLIYDDEDVNEEEEEEEEEDGVALNRVFSIATRKNRSSQSKLLLNISRCYLKSPRGRMREAVEAISLCIHLLKMMKEEEEEDDGEEEKLQQQQQQLLATAYQIRAKALSRASQFIAAKKDARRLGGPPGQRELAQKIVVEIEKDMERKQKSDRKLVKNMSQWIDTAMKSSSASLVEGGGGSNASSGSSREEAKAGEEGCICV